jgi:MFS family permease
MNRGFYNIMAAEFFSSLADNALFITTISILIHMEAPAWMTPLLKLFFFLSYVLLAAFVGPFSDSMPKGRVMFVTNLVKVCGCMLLFFHVHPLLAYGIVGFGAAAYSPAKYGILTELLPPEKLVAANGWIEGLTITSIILGTVLGGALINPTISSLLLSLHIPGIDTGPEAALLIINIVYFLAAFFNLFIPDTGARYEKQHSHPVKLVRGFVGAFKTLWTDKLGQISLALTTLLWGAAAVLQYIVLKWAESHLGLALDKAAFLQGIVAVGVIVGAVSAARFVKLRKSLSVMPLGIGLGFTVMSLTLVNTLWIAVPLLILIGVMSGFFVVPMNALLQHRGHVLLSAGHSIAVQNFNENLSVLIMLGVYATMIWLQLGINLIIVLFGLFVAATIFMIMRWHAANQRLKDSLHLIGEVKH